MCSMSPKYRNTYLNFVISQISIPVHFIFREFQFLYIPTCLNLAYESLLITSFSEKYILSSYTEIDK